MELSSETPGESGVVGRLARRTRSGNRVWPDTIKGRAVFESMKPGRPRVRCSAALRDPGSTIDDVAGTGAQGPDRAGRGRGAGFCDDRSERPSCEQAGGIWRLSTF